MRINIKKLKEEYNNFSNSIEEYIYIYINIYNTFSNAHDMWNSEKSSLFFQDINQEKKNVLKFSNNLKEIKKIYNNLILKYEFLGQAIEIEPNNRNAILNTYELYTEKINNILKKIKNMNLNSSTSIYSKVALYQEKVKSLIQDITLIKQNVIRDFNEVQNIEFDLKQKINEILIEKVEEKEINYYSKLGNNSQNIFFDIDGLEREKNKLSIYLNEESVLFDDFDKQLIKLNSYYSSENQVLLEDKRIELKEVFKSIIEEHRKDLNFLNNEIDYLRSLSYSMKKNMN